MALSLASCVLQRGVLGLELPICSRRRSFSLDQLVGELGAALEERLQEGVALLLELCGDDLRRDGRSVASRAPSSRSSLQSNITRRSVLRGVSRACRLHSRSSASRRLRSELPEPRKQHSRHCVRPRAD